MKQLTSFQKRAIVIAGLIGGGYGIGSLTIIAAREFAVSTMIDVCKRQAREDRENQDVNYSGVADYDPSTGECFYKTDFGHGLIWVQRWIPRPP